MNLPTMLTLESIRQAYAEGASVEQVLDQVLARIEAHDQPQAWIYRLSRAEIAAYVDKLKGKSFEDLPLYGVPFAIKDNIDLANVPTTAACPAYSYTPEHSATVVEKLLAAGAIPLGKTNLDQFATGLVGTRTPYGACHSVFSEDHISGGSSSGSAVVVAAGLVAFALGTDTAGSGRVPAAFNNLIGWKPSKGLLSTRGVVPACRSLDCVSVFGASAADAEQLRRIAAGFDEDDPFSRTFANAAPLGDDIVVGVPRADQLHWFYDEAMSAAWSEWLTTLRQQGIPVREIDFTPFKDMAVMLYDGPWLAERHVAVGGFIENHPAAVWPTTKAIIEKGQGASAAQAFKAEYRRLELKRAAERQLDGIAALMTPTAGRHFTLSEVEQEPLLHNGALGYYTNFMNLLDLAAVALPAGFRSDHLPFGVTISAAAGSDARLLQLADRLHRLARCGAGLDRQAVLPAVSLAAAQTVDIAVCGAHLSGLPLNHQLLDCGAFLLKQTRTAGDYRLYALPNTTPPKPGLVRSPGFEGEGIEVEVWRLPLDRYGRFVAAIPSPLGVGRIRLADGEEVHSFLCESWAVEQAQEVTGWGGWRRWLQRGSPDIG